MPEHGNRSGLRRRCDDARNCQIPRPFWRQKGKRRIVHYIWAHILLPVFEGNEYCNVWVITMHHGKLRTGVLLSLHRTDAVRLVPQETGSRQWNQYHRREYRHSGAGADHDSIADDGRI